MDCERDTSSVGNPLRASLIRRSRLGPTAWMLVGVGFLTQTGCMSVLTATTLREALRETAASLSSPHDLDHASMARLDEPVADVEVEDDAPEGDAELEQVIDNAVARLSAAGGIDGPTQELLIKTLERTRPEDWAVVVNEFAATLEASRGTVAAAATDGGEPVRPRAGGLIELDIPRPTPAATPPVAEIPVAESIDPDDPADLSAIPELRLAPVVVAPSAPEIPPAPPAPLPPRPIDVGDLPVQPIDPGSTPVPVTVAALIEPAPAAESPAPMPPTPETFEPVPVPVAPTTTVEAPVGPVVNNACFATRVRGWGNVERFPTAAFRPGQELIVYFELERLAIRPSAEGHTTGIDTEFRLLDPSGERIGRWVFEPIVETCPAPRRDYFARYFLRIPDDAKPGHHRLQWSVTDTISGASRQAHLDLEVVAGP